ncbi:hypothetical protein E9993_14845 [Labilibacter sediminis]|nr:hypothetical protein E9993_14845 [Labilibacter sediminis]
MKKLKNFTLLLTFLIPLLIIIGCEKDENTEDEKSEVFTTLTSHPWVYDTFYTICNDPEILMWYGLVDSAASATNQEILFEEDYAFLGWFDGDGKWRLENDETEVIIVSDEDQTDIYNHFSIYELTDEILILTDLADVPPSDTCYVQFIFRK